MTPKGVMLTVGLLNVAGAALIAAGMSSVVSPPVAIAVVFAPMVAIFAVLGIKYLRQRRAGVRLTSGTSFGDAALYRSSAWRLAIFGAFLSAVTAVYIGAGTAILFASGSGFFVVGSMILASHSD